ncbi:peroxisomal N(1)-acetyl-spermine/spermidine oxidase-like [Bacillus rossius redtenbacheri]|uniref:peroxisomal N(1)-acetyl-spermine/spermidine oxidase-like n=1 Tax=Bacillus rossius redtenbacheri TaxID=93214 RepID=UPI002FDD517A
MRHRARGLAGCSAPRGGAVQCRVVVVGAGMAGLAAARTLLRGGLTDFVVLEAQACPGGRVQTLEVDGRWLEAGAQWVHGQNHSVWRLASDRGLLSDSVSAEGEVSLPREKVSPPSLPPACGGHFRYLLPSGYCIPRHEPLSGAWPATGACCLTVSLPREKCLCRGRRSCYPVATVFLDMNHSVWRLASDRGLLSDSVSAEGEVATVFLDMNHSVWRLASDRGLLSDSVSAEGEVWRLASDRGLLSDSVSAEGEVATVFLDMSHSVWRLASDRGLLSDSVSAEGEVWRLASDRGLLSDSVSAEGEVWRLASDRGLLSDSVSAEGEVATVFLDMNHSVWRLASDRGLLSDSVSAEGEVWRLASDRGLLSDIVSAEGEVWRLASDRGLLSDIVSAEGEVWRLASDRGLLSDSVSAEGEVWRLASDRGLLSDSVSAEGEVWRLASDRGLLSDSVSAEGEVATVFLDMNHSVWRLASDRGLLSDSVSAEGEGPYLREHGRTVPLDLVQEVGGVVGDIMEECSLFTRQSAPAPCSVGAHLHARFQEHLARCGCDEEGRRLRQELYDWHLRFYVIDNSCSQLDGLSAKAFGTYQFSGGQDYVNFRRGYSSLVQSLADELPAGRLLLGTPVASVLWDAGSPSAQGRLHVAEGPERSGHGPRALVSCSDGQRFEAEHVIVTCSLGYLKEHHATMFQPALPRAMVQAIEDLGFATINKIFLIYDDPWWQPDTRGFQIIWPLHESEFFLENEGCKWLRGLSGFDVLAAQRAVLLGWVGGPGAEAVERLEETLVGRQCTGLLRHFTGRSDVPAPRRTVRTQWHGNQYVRGGYSHHSCRCDVSHSEPAVLAQPVCSGAGHARRPVLLLAGEATHPCYYSTTHGAYETGQRQAERVLAHLHAHCSDTA